MLKTYVRFDLMMINTEIKIRIWTLSMGTKPCVLQIVYSSHLRNCMDKWHDSMKVTHVLDGQTSILITIIDFAKQIRSNKNILVLLKS